MSANRRNNWAFHLSDPKYLHLINYTDYQSHLCQMPSIKQHSEQVKSEQEILCFFISFKLLTTGITIDTVITIFQWQIIENQMDIPFNYCDF